MWKKRLALATLLLTVLLFILIQTASFQQWLLRRIQSLSTGSGFPFKAEKLRLNIFELRASLDGFVYDKDGTKVRVEHVTLDIPWNAFKGDAVVVNSLIADGVTITVRSPEPVLPEPSGKETQLPKLQIGRLGIRNVNLEYTNQNVLVRIPSFSVEAINGRGRIQITEPVTISPDTQIALRDIPIVLGTDVLEFGPTNWSLQYSNYKGTGIADGDLTWSPSVAFHLNYSTQPMTIEKWRDLQSNGKVAYEDGKLKLTDVRVIQGGEGQLIATAEISDQHKTANLLWNELRLDQAGMPGTTAGSLQLQWKASDFSDISGEGVVDIVSRQYGRIHSNVRAEKGRARLDVAANAMDASIRANILAGIDRSLGGTFNVTHRKYGTVDVNGKLGGTFDDPLGNATILVRNLSYEGIGPVNASANAALKGKLLTVSDLRAQLKNSTIPDGFLRVDLERKNISGAIPQINVDVHDFVQDAQGKAVLSAAIDGTSDRPAALFKGASNGVDIGGTHIDSVDVAGRFVNNTLTLSRLDARQAEGRLTATGSVNVTTKRIDANARIDNLQLVRVRDLSTTVFLEARVHGTTTTPATDFKGELQNLVYQGQQHGNVALQGSTQDTTATIQAASDKYSALTDAKVRMQAPFQFDATVTANKSRIQSGEYDVVADGKAQATGQLQPFEIHDVVLRNFNAKGNGIDATADGAMDRGMSVKLTADLAQLPVEGVAMTGTAKVDAVVSGTIKNPRVDGTVVTDNASVQTPQMAEPANIRAAIDFTRDQFVIRQMDAVFADAIAKITGDGTLKGTGQFQFQATNIRPERLFKDRPVSGLVGVDGSFKLTAPTLAGASGNARVTQLDLNLRDVPIRQVQPIEVSLQNQAITIHNFRVEGGSTNANISGGADLRTQALDLNVDGKTDLRILEAFIPGSSAEGQIESRIAIRGTAEKPDLNGFVNVTNTQIQTANPPLHLKNVEAQLRFSGDRMEIANAAGKLNDGEFQASGSAGISTLGLRNASIRLTLNKAQLEYPEGLQSDLSSQIQLAGSSPRLTAEGTVDINSALYREDIDLTQQIFQRITQPNQSNQIGPQARTSGLADQITMDIEVRTPGLVTVSNNMANLDLTGNFRVRGSMANPIIIGRAAVLDGGELYFGPGVATESSTPGERRDRYIIDRGEINFQNTLQTEPNFDFEATHEMQVKDERYLITLRAYGTPERLRTELTSDPFLAEPDIISMLLTGRTFQELQESQTAVGEEQLANYFAGRMSGFFNTAGTSLGLDTMTIEPVSLAEEEDLGARLTLGKDVTKDFGFIYSQNLAGPRDQTWIANYSWIKNLVFRGINAPDKKETRFEVKHDLRIGGGPPLPKRTAPNSDLTVDEVTFTGTSLPAKDLLKKVTKPGKPFNVYRLNEDVRDLEDFLASKDLLNARIETFRNNRDGKIDVRYVIEEGPSITFRFEGTNVPKSVHEDIRSIWRDSFSEATALRDSSKRLTRYMRDEGFLHVKVSYRNESESDAKYRYVFTVEPGQKFDDPKWVFRGIEPLDVPSKAGNVMERPEAIQERIEFELQKEGFLDAKSTAPELIFEEDGPKFVVTVERGNQYMVGRIGFSGNSFLTDQRLLNAVRLGPTNPAPDEAAGRLPETEKELPLFPFTSDWIERAQQRAITEYWQEGYNDIQVTPSTTTDPSKAQVAVHFDFVEGDRQMIESIQVDGVRVTDMSHVMRFFQFKEGDPVDYTRINLTRKKLYDTRLFKRVEIEMVKGQAPNGYIANVQLNETAPWRFRYGFAIGSHSETSDRNLGVTSDFSYGNLFGKGILAGISFKDTRILRDARIYGTLPVFFGRDVRTTVTTFKTRDFKVEGQASDRWGYTLQQQWRLKNFYILSYDYSYRWDHTFDRDPSDNVLIENVTIPIARFNGTITRDTRDDILNATQGTFFSNSFEVAPPHVGSAISYVRNYTQYFRFSRISKNLVWANAIRAGVARAFSGASLLDNEQFTAGGPTTLRAFQQDRLTLSPGNALLILNSELRFPLFWRIGAVTFFDAGNVYERTGNANVLHLRYSPGIGLRIQTPLLLVRLDLGLNLWPRTGELRKKFGWGIGQAF